MGEGRATGLSATHRRSTMALRTVPQASGQFTLLDDGVYVGTITEVMSEMKDADQYHAAAYEQLRVVWEVDDEENEDGTPVTIRAWFTPSMNEKANLVKKLLPAINFPIPKAGEQWDEQDFVGKKAQLQVEQYVATDGNTKCKIVGYLAMRKKKRAVEVEKEDDELF